MWYVSSFRSQKKRVGHAPRLGLFGRALALPSSRQCAPFPRQGDTAPDGATRASCFAGGTAPAGRKHWDNSDVDPAGSAASPDYRRQGPKRSAVHGKLDAARCWLVEFAVQFGLTEAPAGASASFSIVSRDSFGNTR